VPEPTRATPDELLDQLIDAALAEHPLAVLRTARALADQLGAGEVLSHDPRTTSPQGV
jgi:hypothetical protein